MMFLVKCPNDKQKGLYIKSTFVTVYLKSQMPINSTNCGHVQLCSQTLMLRLLKTDVCRFPEKSYLEI